MSPKLFRPSLILVLFMGLLSLGYFYVDAQAKAPVSQNEQRIYAQGLFIGPIYAQPINPVGKLLQSSWRDPDGSDYDQYIWDDFTLQTTETITQIDWIGGYDPARVGLGGPVLDFRIRIYPSIPAGSEPAIANPPLVDYLVGGNAGETPIGLVGSINMYSYTFTLPTAFTASAGVKYWVQIEASQQGGLPDWGFSFGTGGDGNHYRKTSGAGGDVMYRIAVGDAAFTLLGPVPDTATPIDTDTPMPFTDTPIPSTNTPVPSTNTPVPSTNTPVPSTNTPVPSTNTPVPSTNTPVPSTNTPVPFTNTPVPVTTQTKTFTSVGSQDGWILEAGENSNFGAKIDSFSTTFNVGDDATKKQYRAILSFNTGSSLPDTAVITRVTLRIKRQAVSGTGNPFALLQGLMVDAKKGFFGASAPLVGSDFQALATKTGGPFSPLPVGAWYSFNLTNLSASINKHSGSFGLTQLRLRFKLDDNNNAMANYVRFFSGNASSAGDRPALVIEYYLP